MDGVKINTEKHEILERYKKFLHMFVVAERKNNKKAVGILKEITPDKKLYIQGKFMFWLVDPEEIIDFSARPDRHNRGGSNSSD